VGGGGIAALALFAHETSIAIPQLTANAANYSQNAAATGVSFETAALNFETQQRREGVTAFAFVLARARPGPPVRSIMAPHESYRAGRAAFFDRQETSSVAVVDGVVRHNIALRSRYENNRFGYAVAALFGVHPAPPVPFAGGVISFAPDSKLFGSIVFVIVGAIVIACVAVGVLAGVVGTYITQQAIRPLIDVTEALQRFAARDFRAQPIVIAGRSDFDVLALAYNAASAQVAGAFAERDAAEAQMRQFVADAGHELRTPLTIVLGYIDLLRKRVGAGDDRAKFIFASIASEGRRMRTLIDNLVLLAKLESEDVRPVEPFEVGELVGEIVTVRRGLDPAVRIAIDARVDATVAADRGEVYEAVANIVDNAIKYAPGSLVQIELDSPRPGTLAIAVSDEGPGIPPEDRSVIFERFFRGANRGEIEGSGLGLAIAKRALERAGGTIAIDASVTRGTRFVMTLRAERVSRRAAFAQAAAERPARRD
jgi:signal transduction histidine kinase